MHLPVAISKVWTLTRSYIYVQYPPIFANLPVVDKDHSSLLVQISVAVVVVVVAVVLLVLANRRHCRILPGRAVSSKRR